MAANFAAWFYQTRREPALTESHAESAIELAEHHGFASAKLLAGMRRAWALSERGEQAAGIAQLQAGSAEWRKSGAALAHPHFLGLLATAYARSGQYEDAFAALSAALQATERTDERWLQSDLYCLQGSYFLPDRRSRWLKPACSTRSSMRARSGPGCGNCARRWG